MDNWLIVGDSGDINHYELCKRDRRRSPSYILARRQWRNIETMTLIGTHNRPVQGRLPLPAKLQFAQRVPPGTGLVLHLNSGSFVGEQNLTC